MEYGKVPMAPLLWMDDIINGTGSIEEARKVNVKIDCVMKQRGLTLNQEKSVCLILGSKNQKEKLSKDLLTKPLMCGSFITKEKQQEKWLGQILSSAGL